MPRINIKPLSVNEVWQGKRFKTNKYKDYQKQVSLLLPKIDLPPPPYEIHFTFGFSSSASDWDNPIKPTQDVLAAYYKFNDKLIKKGVVTTEKVKKGAEYFNFEILTFNP